MMKEYIEREKVVELTEVIKYSFASLHQKVIDALIYNIDKNIPSADVEPVRHGEWVSARPSGGYDFYCSCCKEFAITYEDNNYREQYYLTDYCPWCGAKMDGGK